MCDIAFKKVQGRAWKVNRTMQKQPSEGFFNSFMTEAVII